MLYVATCYNIYNEYYKDVKKYKFLHFIIKNMTKNFNHFLMIEKLIENSDHRDWWSEIPAR